MLPHDYKKMADSLYSEFGIVAGAGDCERAFSNTLPFSRFLDYARAFGSVGGWSDFLSNAGIWDVMLPIEFDRSIRQILVGATFRIEEWLRTAVFEAGYGHFSKLHGSSVPTFWGSRWYMDPAMYEKRDWFEYYLRRTNTEKDRKNDWWANPSLAPHSWDLAVFSDFSFWSLVRMLESFSKKAREAVGWKYGAKYPSGEVVPGDMVLRFAARMKRLRNECSHGDVVWPKKRKWSVAELPGAVRSWGEDLHAVAAACRTMLGAILPSDAADGFRDDLAAAFADAAATAWWSQMDFMSAMGFENWWEKRPEWDS